MEKIRWWHWHCSAFDVFLFCLMKDEERMLPLPFRMPHGRLAEWVRGRHSQCFHVHRMFLHCALLHVVGECVYCRISIFAFGFPRFNLAVCSMAFLQIHVKQSSELRECTGDLYAHRLTLDTCIKHKRVHHKSNIRYLISCSLQNGFFLCRLPFHFAVPEPECVGAINKQHKVDIGVTEIATVRAANPIQSKCFGVVALKLERMTCRT